MENSVLFSHPKSDFQRVFGWNDIFSSFIKVLCDRNNTQRMRIHYLEEGFSNKDNFYNIKVHSLLFKAPLMLNFVARSQ